MAVYTVVIDTGDAGLDEVLAELERVPSVVVVQFMGPGALVDAEQAYDEALSRGDTGIGDQA